MNAQVRQYNRYWRGPGCAHVYEVYPLIFLVGTVNPVGSICEPNYPWDGTLVGLEPPTGRYRQA